MKWWTLIVASAIVSFHNTNGQDLDPAEPVPEKCSSYNVSGNGTILYTRTFLCTSSDNPYCCGEEGQQYCCSSSSSDTIFLAIFGVIAGLSVLIFIGFCVIRHMKSKWSRSESQCRLRMHQLVIIMVHYAVYTPETSKMSQRHPRRNRQYPNTEDENIQSFKGCNICSWSSNGRLIRSKHLSMKVYQISDTWKTYIVSC